jgi:hypothetical protein
MSNYRADCSSCCGLCCVVPHQLMVQGFGADKPADMPCIHLNRLHRCSIHGTRREHGYPACENFDCFGAGQWVTQHLFGGARWTDSPDMARQMFAAYRYWTPRFEAAALIEAALPYVRDGARRSLSAIMTELTSGKSGGDRTPGDANRLRQVTLTAIRAALRMEDEST